jgi:pilus assembly protein CpaB
MRVITIVSLGASAVLGLGALVVAKTVLPNQSKATAAAVGAVARDEVAVVVAAKDMKYGDKVSADLLRVVRVPAEVAPQGAFTTVGAVLAADNGGAPVVLMPITAREPILPAKLSGPGARPSVAAEIKDGMRAYTIKVSDVTGVGGHALPGDRVDVVLLRELPGGGDNRNYVSEIVLQDVRVLAVDLNADLASDKPASPSTATLEVNVMDAQKLSVAADLGKLSLALRRTGSAEVLPTKPVRASVFGGGGGAAPRPSGAHRASGGGGILIIEGDRRIAGPRAAAAPAAAATTAG